MEDCIINKILKSNDILEKDEIELICKNKEIFSLVYLIATINTIKFIKKQS